MHSNESHHKIDDNPIFIAGSQRTGTTLLCRIFTAHPNIFISNEIPPVTELNPAPGFSRKTFLDMLNASIQQEYGHDLHALLQKEGKSRWGLKVPQLLYHIDDLVKNFPDCKIILLIRDGRAFSNSLINTKWGHVNTYITANLWIKEMELLKRALKQYPDNCIAIKYEKLLLETDDVLEKCARFAHEEYVDEMKYYFKQPSFIQKKSTSKNVFGEIKPDFIDKWKSQLTPFQVNVFETIAGGVLKENGYPLIGKKIRINSLLKLWFILQSKIIGEYQLQQKRNLWSKKSRFETIRSKFIRS